ncbi:transposase [Bradyrhizobium sp. 44]|nr:transposase [Bradyrhizobium sp. 44]UPJ44100.1 transposase [Bradyrhizobium sp. 40]
MTGLHPFQARTKDLRLRRSVRNELKTLLARLAPDHKTIADFRKDNGPGIKKVCARFVEVCRKMGLLATASVAVDGSKFKAVNNRDKSPQRRIKRWVHEDVLERAQARLDKNPNAMRTRRETVEHPFGTLKMRMGATRFLCVTLPKVATEMALCVLGYNLTRVLNIVGMKPLLAAVRA